MNTKLQSNESISSIKKKIIPILKRNHVVKAGIFGSYARGEAKRKSDIDILVQFKKEKRYLIWWE
jgi:uncharacterized protein